MWRENLGSLQSRLAPIATVFEIILKVFEKAICRLSAFRVNSRYDRVKKSTRDQGPNRVYTDRTAGGHRYYRYFGRAVAAGLEQGQIQGLADRLPEQSPPAHHGLVHVS